MDISNLSYAVVDEQPLWFNFYDHKQWGGWEAELHDPNDEEDPDNHMPMFNYAYPLPDEYELNLSRARKALKHYALTVVSLADHDRYYLVLTGGGMDMSWDICGAYIALGFYPPARFCRLPEMAGDRLTPEKQAVIEACRRSLRAVTGWVERSLDDLYRLEVEMSKVM